VPFKLKVNMLHALLSEQRDHFISRHPDFRVVRLAREQG
jgi:hypothetical protein